LDVDVKDCNVTRIKFNNGGYLDGSHIHPTKLNGDGNAQIKDDKGIVYKIHIF